VDYIDDPAILSEKIRLLELEISTVDANDGDSSSLHYVNVVFADGTRIFEPFNLGLYLEDPVTGTTTGTLPGRGNTKRFTIFGQIGGGGIERKLEDIAEIFLRKADSDGWFVGSMLLFANGHDQPLLGNSNANQFLDNDNEVLLLRDWPTGSLCVAQATDASHPLARSGYMVMGPVIGQVSDTSAVVIYRVDREGNYRFRATEATSGTIIYDQSVKLEPTGRFELYGLQPNRCYSLNLSFVRSGIEYQVPNAVGAFRTFPPDRSRGRFTFAFGSCANPDRQAAQGSWTAIRALAESPPMSIDPVRLFVHLGDTFYFYDHITEEVPPVNVESMHAAHISMRRHVEFLDMAKVLPSCGIWDDHDFAGDNTDSTSIKSELLIPAAETWLKYWGNQLIFGPEGMGEMGLTTRISHGLVDIYLLDGRFKRDKDEGVCFGKNMIVRVLQTIDDRGTQTPRVVVLGTGSSWNHHDDDEEGYGHSEYDNEREDLYKELSSRMGKTINGLLFISGDYHINEIYHVKLHDGRMAPEFVSSPLTMNSGLSGGREIEGERVESFSSKEKRGFATLTIDTSRENSDSWTATVRYLQEAAATLYESRVYTLTNGQFNPA